MAGASARPLSFPVRCPGMRRLTTLMALVLLAACASQTSRQSGSSFFDCNAPAGKYVDWNRAAEGDEVHVSGTIELIEPRRDPKWGPVAYVYIMGNERALYMGLKLA